MTACDCAACRANPAPASPPVWPSDAWFDRFNARNRELMGKPALPDVSELPADVRAFVEGM